MARTRSFAASTGSGTMAVAAASAVPTGITVSATPSSVTLGRPSDHADRIGKLVNGRIYHGNGNVHNGWHNARHGLSFWRHGNVEQCGRNCPKTVSQLVRTRSPAPTAEMRPLHLRLGNGSLTVAAAPAPIVTSYTLAASSTTLTASSSVTLTLTSANYAGTVTLTPTVTSTDAHHPNVTASLDPTSVTLTSNGTGNLPKHPAGSGKLECV